MKLITLLLIATALPLLAAETNPAPAPGSAETHITSKSVQFDMKTRQAVYKGDVQVKDPRIDLNCELLTATVSEGGGRVDNLVAESNVVAVITTNNTVFTVTAPKAIYIYQVQPTATNQTLELTGLPEPKITWPQPDSDPVRTNECVGRRILWDFITGVIDIEGHRGVFPSIDSFDNPLQEINKASSTNAPTAAPATNP